MTSASKESNANMQQSSPPSTLAPRHPLDEGPLSLQTDDPGEDVPASFFSSSNQGTVRAASTIRASRQGSGASSSRPGYFDLQRLAGGPTDEPEANPPNIASHDGSSASGQEIRRTRSASRASSIFSSASSIRRAEADDRSSREGSVSGRSRRSREASESEPSHDRGEDDEELPSWINENNVRSSAFIENGMIKPRPRTEALNFNNEKDYRALFTPRSSIAIPSGIEASMSAADATEDDIVAQLKNAVEEAERWKRAHDDALARHARELSATRKDHKAREDALLEILTAAGISKARAERALINASAQAKVPTFRADERIVDRTSRIRSPNPFGTSAAAVAPTVSSRSPSGPRTDSPIESLRRSLSSEDKLPASIMEAMLDDFQADLQYHQAQMDSSRPSSAMSMSRAQSPTPSVRSTISRATQAASSISSINGIISTLTWRKKKSKGQEAGQSPSPSLLQQQTAPSTDAATTLTKALDKNRRRQSHSSKKADVEPNVTRLPALFSHSFVGSQGNAASASHISATRELEPILADDVRPPTLTIVARRKHAGAAVESLRHAVESPPSRESVYRSNEDNHDEYQSSGDEFEVYGGKHLSPEERAQRVTSTIQKQREAGAEDSMLTDRYGFVYDATPADVRLLRRARKQAIHAPACLTGIRVGLRARGGSASASEDERSSDKEEEILASNPSPNEVNDDEEHGVVQTELDPEMEPSIRTSISQASKPITDSSTSPLTTPGIPGMLDIASGRPSISASSLTAAVAHSDKQPGPTSPEEERAHFLNGHESIHGAKAVARLSEERNRSIADKGLTKKRPPSTSQTVRSLLAQLQEMHMKQQEVQQQAWDQFLSKRKAFLRGKVETGAAAKQAGSGGVNAIDSVISGTGPAEEQWSVGGLIDLGQLGTSTRDRRELHKLVQSGVPLVYRPKIWYECSGAIERAEPGRYEELLKEHESETNSCTQQIDLDVGRTMPTNIYFAGDGPGVVKLRRLLVAYSWQNPECGYCQGMNNLAATLLLTHATEEEAFWVLASIIENILPQDYFTSHLLVAQADQRVLIDIIRDKLPKLAKHIDQLGVDLPAVTFAWFLSLYTDCLPVETLFRVWDVFLVEGMPTLFRIAVAIFALNESDILATQSPSAFYGLMHGMTSHMFSADKLISVACDDLRSSIRADKIKERRAVHMRDLTVELGLDAGSSIALETPSTASIPS